MPVLCPCVAEFRSSRRVVASPGSKFYLVDCEAEREKTNGKKGLVYRHSKNLDDPVVNMVATWGDIVEGVREDDEWVRVQSKYLPTTFGHHTVLFPGCLYKLENARLQAKSPAGVFLRGSKDFNDKTKLLKKWGSTLLGFPVEEGWVRVGNNYLPTLLGEEQYLHPEGADGDDLHPHLADGDDADTGKDAVTGSAGVVVERAVASLGSERAVASLGSSVAVEGAVVAKIGESETAQNSVEAWAQEFQGRWQNAANEVVLIKGCVVEWPDNTSTPITDAGQTGAGPSFGMTYGGERLKATLNREDRCLHWDDGDLWVPMFALAENSQIPMPRDTVA